MLTAALSHGFALLAGALLANCGWLIWLRVMIRREREGGEG